MGKSSKNRSRRRPSPTAVSQPPPQPQEEEQAAAAAASTVTVATPEVSRTDAADADTPAGDSAEDTAGDTAGELLESSSSSTSSPNQQAQPLFFDRQSIILLSLSYKIYLILLVAVVLCYTTSIHQAVVYHLLPYGPAAFEDVTVERFAYANIDPSNTLLQLQHGRTQKIYERLDDDTTNENDGAKSVRESLLKAPETVLFDHDGTMYLMTEEAKLIRLSDFREENQESNFDKEGHEKQPMNMSAILTAKTTFVSDLGCGRPLGGAFVPPSGSRIGWNKPKISTLYIADAILGLTRIRNIHDPTSKLEIVVSSVAFEDNQENVVFPQHTSKKNNQVNNTRKRLLYVDDVVVGRKSHKVYFTDASDIAPIPTSSFSSSSSSSLEKWKWDTLYASKLDLLRNKGSGSVYEYNPVTEQVRCLMSGLKFANGISIDPDERFLVVAETFGPKLHKYHLQGDRAGQREVLIADHQLPGYPDGVDCDPLGTFCYVVMPSAIVPIHKLLRVVSPWLEQLLRTLLLMLPPSLAPPVKEYGVVGQVDLRTVQNNDRSNNKNNNSSSVLSLIQDPTGKDLSMLCGVTWHDHKLYFGSVHNNYVGVYHLPR